MARKYDKYVVHPPHSQVMAGDDGRVVFDGHMVHHTQLGYNMTMGLQIVTKPFLSDNPCHTHNFNEFLAWYGATPGNPDDFGAEVVIYLGKEKEKYIFTTPTIVYLPMGFPHCPLEITRVDRPIIQLEIMLVGEGGTRDAFFEEDRKIQKPATFKVIDPGK
jgi:hypothetical protein